MRGNDEVDLGKLKEQLNALGNGCSKDFQDAIKTLAEAFRSIAKNVQTTLKSFKEHESFNLPVKKTTQPYYRMNQRY